MHALADRIFDEFGAVHVPCNNAGVMPVGRILETDMADGRWGIRLTARVVDTVRRTVDGLSGPERGDRDHRGA